MGVLFSCPVEEDGGASEGGLISMAKEEATFLKALMGCGRLRIDGSLSFKRLQVVETTVPWCAGEQVQGRVGGKLPHGVERRQRRPLENQGAMLPSFLSLCGQRRHRLINDSIPSHFP